MYIEPVENYKNKPIHGLSIAGNGAPRNHPDDVPPPPPINVAYEAFNAANQLANDVSELVYKLLGPVSQGVDLSKHPDGTSPAAVFPALQQSAQETLRNISTAAAALDRLRSQLP